jgi:hypothetical protein
MVGTTELSNFIIHVPWFGLSAFVCTCASAYFVILSWAVVYARKISTYI